MLFRSTDISRGQLSFPPMKNVAHGKDVFRVSLAKTTGKNALQHMLPKTLNSNRKVLKNKLEKVTDQSYVKDGKDYKK